MEMARDVQRDTARRNHQPPLSNIYLDVLDKWVEGELMPLYNRGQKEDKGRKRNPEYRNYEFRGQAKKKGDRSLRTTAN